MSDIVEAINTALDISGKSVGLSNSLLGLGERVKLLLGASEASGNAELKTAISELSDQLSNAKLANAELRGQIAEIKNLQLKVEQFESEVSRYSLWETPRGHFVYALNEADARGDPHHYLCPNCIGDRRKSILNGSQYSKTCNKCSTSFEFDPPPPRGQTKIMRG